MEHVNDIELIELAAGRLDSTRCAAVQEHLAACRECRARSEEIAAAWRALAAWEAPSARGGFAADVMDAARRDRARAPRILGLRWRAVRRLAASVLAAALAGYAAGRWLRPPARPQHAAAEEQQLIEELRLYVLNNVSPTGIAGALLDAPERVEVD